MGNNKSEKKINSKDFAKQVLDSVINTELKLREIAKDVERLNAREVLVQLHAAIAAMKEVRLQLQKAYEQARERCDQDSLPE